MSIPYSAMHITVRTAAIHPELTYGAGIKRSCVDDPVEARAIWYVAPRSGAVMCSAYVARS